MKKETVGIRLELPSDIHELIKPYQDAHKKRWNESINKDEVCIHLMKLAKSDLIQETKNMEKEYDLIFKKK